MSAQQQIPGRHSGPAAAERATAPRPRWPIYSDMQAARSVINRLRPIALRSLAGMYSPSDRLFAFRVRPGAKGLAREGLSPRYTAITLIGLAEEPPETVEAVLGDDTVADVCSRLIDLAPRMSNLGDVALTLWAARALGNGASEVAALRLAELDPVSSMHPTVEVAWSLAGLSVGDRAYDEALASRLAERLMGALHPSSHLFPHVLGGPGGGRAHVSCYADLVYPIHALSCYAQVSGEVSARETAARAATRLCELQGEDGQWWWHYDYRNGRIVERYPVYAIHQDAMGPMALFAVRRADGPDCGAAIARGVNWLAASPELAGGSLIDEGRGVIWRKVARREPGKLSRYLNAGASRVYAPLRVPGLDGLFPARSIDFEDRPYHLGWMLYAWSPRLGDTTGRTRADAVE